MTPSPFDDLSKHTEAIQRIASVLCGSGADADDVGQELWLAAHQRDGTAPVAWLPWFAGTGRRILWARRRSEGRRRAREQRAARAEPIPSAEERAIRMESEERLLKLVRQLPAAQSEVVYLRFWEALPPREIAKRLGISVEAVKTRQKRALVILRQRLSEETPGGRDVWMSALAGLPLASSHSGGIASTSITSLGVLMSAKQLTVALVLTIFGAGWWFTRPASELLPPSSEMAHIAEESPIEEGATAALLAMDEKSERALAIEPSEQEAQPVSVSEDVLIITGRVWNVPSGGDRTTATPAVGVTVRLGWFLSGMGGEAVPTDVTDGAGAFRLEHDAGDFHAQMSVGTFRDATYDSGSGKLKWQKDSLERLEVDVYRVAFGGLEGQVVDHVGDPVTGARMVFMSDEEPVRETVSDERGHFAFPKSAEYGYVLGELPGWMTLASPGVTKNKQGGWEPIQVIMCETGALSVRVETTKGAPVAGVGVLLSPSPDESLGNLHAGSTGGYRAHLRGETDGSGMAEFPQAWAGIALRVRPGFAGSDFWVDRERGDDLVTEISDRGARPISLIANAERQLTLRIQPVRTLRCRVVGVDGSPYQGAHVRLNSEQQISMEPGTIRCSSTTDEEGRCEFEIFSPCPLGPGLLTASDTQVGYSRWKRGDSPLATSLALDLDQLPEEEVLLTLAPTFAIAGKLVDGEGNPLRGKVRANPIESELVAGRLSTGFHPEVHASSDGGFIIAGLPKGPYEIVAKNPDLAQVTLPDVYAGTDDLVIAMEAPPVVRIDVHFDTGDLPVRQYVTLVGWHTPAKGTLPLYPALPRTKSYSEPVGWPEDMQRLWYGSGGSSDGSARTRYWLVPTNEPHKVLNLDPGAYWIGAQARSEDGTLFAQMGTGLVQVVAGKYRITFKMRPCVELSGRVGGVAPVDDLALALALPGGELLPLDVGRESMHSIIELGATGGFHLKRVPAGKYELRVGTRTALESGGAMVTRSIELVPGNPLQIVIDL